MSLVIRAINGAGNRHIEWDFDPAIQIVPWENGRFMVRKLIRAEAGRHTPAIYEDLGNFAGDWSVVVIDDGL